MRCTQLLISALAYATFRDRDIERATEELIGRMEKDLDEAGYEASSDTEDAEDTLEGALNAADESSEDLDAAIVNAEPGEEEDVGGDEDTD